MSKGKGGGSDMPKKGGKGGAMPKMKLENAGKGSPSGGKKSGKMS